MGDHGISRTVHKSQQGGSGSGSRSQSMINELLNICRGIESRVSSFGRCFEENSNLSMTLNQVETNFLMLLRTSQAEIAKLKRGLHGANKKEMCDGVRGKCTLDPRRSLNCGDIIQCLHTPVGYEIQFASNRTQPSRRQSFARPQDRVHQRRLTSTSSSSSSSSVSSSSSSSSVTSTTASEGHKPTRPRPEAPFSAINSSRKQANNLRSKDICNREQKRHEAAPCSIEKRRRTEQQKTTNSHQVRKPSTNRPPKASARGTERRDEVLTTTNDKKPQHDAYHEFVSSAEESSGRALRSSSQRHVRPKVTTDAKTGVDDGPAMHLLCLVGASIRNARMHHSASVDLAPPIRGKHLSESERMVVESYLQASERRCQSNRARSCSPQQSTAAFSPTLFTRRQMFKHVSLCASPNIVGNTTGAEVAADVLETPPSSPIVPPRSPVAPKTPPEPPEEQIPVVLLHPSKAPSLALGEEEQKEEDEDYEEGDENEQEEPSRGSSGDERETEENHAVSPQQDGTKADGFDVEQPDAYDENVSSAEDGEAMSEGEINDEDDADEDTTGENNFHNNHRHHRNQRHQQKHHSTSGARSNHNCSDAAPSSSSSQQRGPRQSNGGMRPHHNISLSHRNQVSPGVVSSSRRRYADECSPARKRLRRSDEGATGGGVGFGRPRYSSPPPLPIRRRVNLRAPPSSTMAAAAARRWRFSSGGNGAPPLRRGPGEPIRLVPPVRRTNPVHSTALARSSRPNGGRSRSFRR